MRSLFPRESPPVGRCGDGRFGGCDAIGPGRGRRPHRSRFGEALPAGNGHIRQPQQRRLRHLEQHDDLLGRGFRQAVSQCEDSNRGQGFGHGAASPDPGAFPLRADVAEDEKKEEDSFEAKHGYKPTRIDVAVDCLAVYVHKDNPIQGLTLTQLDGIFSTTRASGAPEIKTWGDLGLRANGPICRSVSTAVIRPAAPTSISRNTC